MKDLKHLYYFEKLLDDANNELVRQAQDEGLKCIATTCENVPEPLLNLPGTFSVRLRAPRTGSMEMATYYMTSFLCEYSRALLERAIEGGYNYLGALFGAECCKDGFFWEYMEIPQKNDDNALEMYTLQCRNHILKPLAEKYGIDTSDEAIRAAVDQHNEVCRLIRQIGDFRKEANPRVTGYEFHILTMASYVAPKHLILDKLRETLEEIKTREPDAADKYRARVVFVGSEVDDVDVIKLVEESGAYVCADRFCYGSLPGRDEIILNDEEDVVKQICRQVQGRAQCPRYWDMAKMIGRRDYVADLAKEYGADGIIYEQMKFCDPWAYERMIGTIVLRDEHGYPVLAVDRPYSIGSSGQMRTRVQAFVESIEIKKIQGGKK